MSSVLVFRQSMRDSGVERQSRLTGVENEPEKLFCAAAKSRSSGSEL